MITKSFVRLGIASTALALLAACSSSGNSEVSTPPATPDTGASSSSPAVDQSVPAFTDPALIKTITDAASHDIQVINSYDYRKLDAYLSAALGVSTGTFQDSLRTTFSSALEAKAPLSKTIQTAKITDTAVQAVSEANDAATVLVWGGLLITDSTHSAKSPEFGAFGVVVTVSKVGSAWLISSYTPDTASTGASIAPGTPALAAAEVAAQAEAAQVVTYSRATFDADFAKALAGSTGTLKTQLAGKRDETLTSMKSGKYDVAGKAVAAGIGSISGHDVVVLVTVSTAKSTDGSTTPTASVQRLKLTMTLVGSTWLASDLAAAGIS